MKRTPMPARKTPLRAKVSLRRTAVEEQIVAGSVPEPNTGCWLWMGSHTGNGYPSMNLGGKGVPAHRMSYSARFGEIPAGLLVCHRCDTPSCVNPDHLFLGTFRDNARDCIRKGRASYPPVVHVAKTHCPRGHEYNDANTRHRPDGGRSCRACHRDRMRVAMRERRRGAAS